MYKISFKDQPKHPYKTVEHYGKVTKVSLTGFLKVEDVSKLPFTIWYEDTLFADKRVERGIHGFCITVTAKAKCADDDEYDEVIGERIAECRAKLKLYKAMHSLLKKSWMHYFKIMIGKGFVEVHGSNSNGGIYTAMKKYRRLIEIESAHLEKLTGR